MSVDTQRISGKAGFLTYNGVIIPFTRLTPKVARKLGDTTDSADYDQDSDMIGTTQIPVTYTFSATLEGRFRRATTPTSFIANAFNSLTQIPIEIGLDFVTGLTWGSGLCDLSNFQTDEPVDDIVNWSADIVSWGIFTPNAGL